MAALGTDFTLPAAAPAADYEPHTWGISEDALGAFAAPRVDFPYLESSASTQFPDAG